MVSSAYMMYRVMMMPCSSVTGPPQAPGAVRTRVCGVLQGQHFPLRHLRHQQQRRLQRPQLKGQRGHVVQLLQGGGAGRGAQRPGAAVACGAEEGNPQAGGDRKANPCGLARVPSRRCCMKVHAAAIL